MAGIRLLLQSSMAFVKNVRRAALRDATACLPGLPVLIESPGEVKGRKGDRQVDQMNRLHRLEAQRRELGVKGPWATFGAFSITLTDEFGVFSTTLTPSCGVTARLGI